MDVAAVVRSLPPGVFFVMVGLALFMTAVPVYAGFHTRSRMRRVAAMPTSQVALATGGYREFEGTLETIGGQSLSAPLTGAACAWYHAKLEVFRRETKTSLGGWRTLRDTTSIHPFLLRDGTGVAVVLPDGAEVTPTDRSVWFGSQPVPEDRNPPRFKPTESPEGMVRVHGGLGRRYRYTEERMYAGDPLYALGEFITAPWDEDEAEDADDELDAASAGDAADDRDVGDEEDEEEDDEAGGEPFDESAAGKVGGAAASWGPGWDGDERYDELRARAAALTSRRLQRGASGPFLISTTPQRKMLELQGLAWKGALLVALVPAGLATLLLWLRYA